MTPFIHHSRYLITDGATHVRLSFFVVPLADLTVGSLGYRERVAVAGVSASNARKSRQGES